MRQSTLSWSIDLRYRPTYNIDNTLASLNKAWRAETFMALAGKVLTKHSNV